MHSSTSSSDLDARETAADRPGEAQPVPERPIPARPWRSIMLAAVLLFAAMLGAWEFAMRAQQLRPDDYGLEPSAWAAQRRLIDRGDVRVAIVGDSRLLFGTDLAHFERLTGERPVQLALPGSSALPMIEDLAADEAFHGLLIAGVAEPIFFRDNTGPNAMRALARYRDEMPSQRSGYLLSRVIERHAAFVDPNYRLSRLVTDLDQGWRQGARSGRFRPWKAFEIDRSGQAWLWPRVETDARIRDQLRGAWLGPPKRPRPPIPPAAIDAMLVRARVAVEAIRARGGDVVFVRPPSAGGLRAMERRLVPRTVGWDALLRRTGSAGVHFEDRASMQHLAMPEWSHVTHRCARVLTDSYVRGLVAVTPRLTLRTDAPPPLAPRDCTAVPVR